MYLMRRSARSNSPDLRSAMRKSWSTCLFRCRMIGGTARGSSMVGDGDVAAVIHVSVHRRKEKTSESRDGCVVKISLNRNAIL